MTNEEETPKSLHIDMEGSTQHFIDKKALTIKKYTNMQ